MASPRLCGLRNTAPLVVQLVVVAGALRWERGDGAPEMAPGEARQDGKQARHDGDGE